jgi:hypothetical protein
VVNNSDRFWSIIDNADSFSVRTNSDKIEFGWAQQVNLAFAVELYLKAIMEAEKQEIKRGHNLKTLFNFLDNKTREAIYNHWRKLAGENMPDNKKIKDWFKDNIFASSNIFLRFRYIHEWIEDSCRTSVEASWDSDQWRQLSICSGEREFGRLPVYDNFLKEFESAVKNYLRESVIPKVPRRTHDVTMVFEINSTITRADGSTKTETQKVVIPMNLPKDE